MKMKFFIYLIDLQNFLDGKSVEVQFSNMSVYGLAELSIDPHQITIDTTKNQPHSIKLKSICTSVKD